MQGSTQKHTTEEVRAESELVSSRAKYEAVKQAAEVENKMAQSCNRRSNWIAAATKLYFAWKY